MLSVRDDERGMGRRGCWVGRRRKSLLVKIKRLRGIEDLFLHLTLAFNKRRSIARRIRSLAQLTPLILAICSITRLAHSHCSLLCGLIEIHECVHAENAINGNDRDCCRHKKHARCRWASGDDDDEWPRAISKFADNDCLHYGAIVHSKRVWSLAKSPKAIKDAHFQSTGSQT